MLGYYLELALRNLRRNVALTLLTVVLVGAGVGCFTFAFTTLRVMSSDPIPRKSSVLFALSLGSDDPAKPSASDGLRDQLQYRDAAELIRTRRAVRQAAMFDTRLEVIPQDRQPFTALGMAVNADFFSMFEVPFRAGSAWTRSEEKGAENVVVLTADLANRLFPAGDPINRDLVMHGHSFRIVGVLNRWDLLPRFYEVGRAFSAPEEFYIPLSTAVADEIDDGGNYSGCLPPALEAPNANHYRALLDFGCFQMHVWVELPTKSSVEDYRSSVVAYIKQQQLLGRFPGTPLVALRNVRDWLVWAHVVPNEVLLRTYLAIGFLFICLVNAAGLILAQLSRRSTELSVRRAMGASRLAICGQILWESAMVGSFGGLMGVSIAALALAWERAVLSQSAGDVVSRLTQMDMGVVLAAIVAGVLTTMGSALYPAWTASRVPPARQLKLQ